MLVEFALMLVVKCELMLVECENDAGRMWTDADGKKLDTRRIWNEADGMLTDADGMWTEANGMLSSANDLNWSW
jgi:hypothetical protein